MDSVWLASGRIWESFTEVHRKELIKGIDESAKGDDLLEVLVEFTFFCLDGAGMEKWMVQIRGADDLHFVSEMKLVASGN